MWPVYSHSIFADGAWASFLRVDVWGHAALMKHSMTDGISRRADCMPPFQSWAAGTIV
jgi:hypothetical protein